VKDPIAMGPEVRDKPYKKSTLPVVHKGVNKKKAVRAFEKWTL